MTVAELLEEARSRIDRATPTQLAAAVEEGAIVIDTRCERSRRATGVIPGSIAIGRSVLEWRCDPASEWSDPSVAKPHERVVLVCEDGYSSSLAADTLRLLGFDRVGDLVGGMTAWLEQGLAVTAA